MTGPDRHTALPWVHHVWRRCAEMAGMNQAVAALPAAPPAALEDLPAGSRPVAACTGPGPGVHQALLYREHDLLCLSVVLAPDAPTGWEVSERLWERLVDGAPVAAPTIGEARLFLAAGQWPPTPRAAVTRSGFRVWEEPTRDDQRQMRRLFAVAPAGHAVRLSDWTWTSGPPVPAPLTRYLMSMATIRHQLRMWSHADELRAARDEADTLLDRLTPTLDDDPVAVTTTEETVLTWTRHLARLRSTEARLVTAASDLRRVRRTVQIAAANRDRAIRPEVSPDPAGPGPFRDDHALTEWFTHRLDDDGEYLDAARERISTLTPLIEHALAQRWQDRRERISLAQAAVVGALVVLLTTAQAVAYDVPLPNAAKSGLVITAGAAALYLPLLALRPAVPAHRARITRYAHVALAAACAGAAWTVTVAAAPGAGPAATMTPPVVAFAVVWAAATVTDLLRRRRRRGAA
ncbi:CATRA conflict system CASPASE/TPR repeat-associated protein [Polymorphospora sp. NPDC050346]|uniref:CATRA conflict system CASPASE/TPR repeat-associated protein n=1 Tax=Polymorphospora sp. NPDC050346 TaxID=3155780 RepID=UPI0033EBD2D7